MWLPTRDRGRLASSASASQPIEATPAKATSASATSTREPSPVRARLTNALETAETTNIPVIMSQAGRTWLTGVLELVGPVISGTPTSALME